MSPAWVAVAAIGVTSMLLKGFGPAVLGGRPLPPRLAGVVALLAPTLLAALIVVAVLDDAAGSRSMPGWPGWARRRSRSGCGPPPWSWSWSRPGRPRCCG